MSKSLEHNIQTIFFLLSTEDNKYPKQNFYNLLVEATKDYLITQKLINDNLDEQIEVAIKSAVKDLVQELEYNGNWSYFIKSSYSSDIYTELLSRICGDNIEKYWKTSSSQYKLNLNFWLMFCVIIIIYAMIWYIYKIST